ncbi:FAD-dependent monooxygenase [Luteolibacter pohnpeiensis]|uniref:FAD-dependent monooxygenase n=1 Tax=Luteolibacter pohnpeiensis TaxID=454153 RepID=A0A934S8K8_9BACT|nr:FAD-dependent monooxygenase [Luteolibacter pohnpeiensis]MBK1884147.1 FAD-dependent monooxygenase [Luteolibacter pohnpeiensis]
MQTTNQTVLISGASFAGLSSAFWMSQLGYKVKVVEIAPKIRSGGTAVNIRGNTIDVVKRMGIFDKIRSNRLSLRQWEFKNVDDHTERKLVVRTENEPPSDLDYEIERDALMQILLEAVRDRCEIVLGDKIVGLNETDRVEVTFKNGKTESFDLVLGCDGVHSGVRKIQFGEESNYIHFLQQYFSITIVDKLLIERDTAQLFNVPGKVVMLNAYKNKTDIIFGFVSEKEIAYDYRDEAQQRRFIAEEFNGVGWRTEELLKEIQSSESFYFDKMCQIRMPSWSSGRIALVGDAAYCASPAAGMGGSLAIDGAAALGDAMRTAGKDYRLAFETYEKKFRPFISKVQAEAVQVGLEILVPRTEEAIRIRNSAVGNEFF